MSKPFADRADAGRVLAEELAAYAGRPDVIVLGLPRGGIPVAYEVACALGAPLDVFLVRKLGAPGQEELAMGAIASGDVVVVNDEVIEALKISPEELKAEVENESRELERREAIYRGGRPLAAVKGKTVILIDDGLATGSTMRAAVAALRRQEPAQIVVAVPVGASSTCAEFEGIADRCVCAIAPEHFRSVGLWYEDFAQTDDDEVCDLLARAAARQAGAQSDQAGSRGMRGDKLHRRSKSDCSTQAPERDDRRREVAIAAGGRTLRGTLRLPHRCSRGHRLRTRQRQRPAEPAQPVRRAGLARGRPGNAVDRSSRRGRGQRPLQCLRHRAPGRPAASRGALAGRPGRKRRACAWGTSGPAPGPAAALVAAAQAPDSIGAIVSRGGRPDLAGDALPRVTAPCLLIVGGNDQQVLELNRQAFERLKCLRRLVVVPGATHLFPEPGALEEVARLAKEWFLSNYLLSENLPCYYRS